MTSATTASEHRRPGAVALHGAVAAAALAPGLLVAGVGALVSGGDAAGAALIGALAVLAVLLFGSVTVDVVSGLMPHASLMVALLTYTLQLMLVVVLLVTLSEQPAFASLAERRWLFGGLLAVVLAWMAGQVTAAVRVRIPVYDLRAPSRTEADAGDAT